VATTIAKLAAVLTVDDISFIHGLSNATKKIQDFDAQTSKMGKSLLKLAGFAGAFGGFSGTIGPLSTFIGPWGLLAAAVAGAGSAMIKASADMAKVNQEFDDEKIKRLREYAKVFSELQGHQPGGFNRFQKTSEEQQRDIERGRAAFVKQLLDEANKMPASDPLGRWLKRRQADLAGMWGFRPSEAASEAIGEGRQHELDRITKKTREYAEELKHQEEAEKRANDTATKYRETLNQIHQENENRAKQLREILDPTAKLTEEFGKLGALFRGGFIDQGILDRGIKHFGKSFMDERLKEFKSFSTESPGALVRGTTAEFSARTQSGRQTQALEREQKLTNRILKEIKDELSKAGLKPPVKFGVADL